MITFVVVSLFIFSFWRIVAASEVCNGGEETDFEFAIAVPRRPETVELDINADCAVEVLVAHLKKSGFYVERVGGVNHEFIKVSPLVPAFILVFLS